MNLARGRGKFPRYIETELVAVVANRFHLAAPLLLDRGDPVELTFGASLTIPCTVDWSRCGPNETFPTICRPVENTVALIPFAFDQDTVIFEDVSVKWESVPTAEPVKVHEFCCREITLLSQTRGTGRGLICFDAPKPETLIAHKEGAEVVDDGFLVKCVLPEGDRFFWDLGIRSADPKPHPVQFVRSPSTCLLLGLLMFLGVNAAQLSL